MKFNAAIKILLNENIDHLEEMARKTKSESLPGYPTPDYDKEALKNFINNFYKKKALGHFLKINNNVTDIDPSEIIIPVLDEYMQKNTPSTVKERLFGKLPNNNEAAKWPLFDSLKSKTEEELGTSFTKTSFAKKTASVVMRLISQASDILFDPEMQDDTSNFAFSNKEEDKKTYRIVKNLADEQIQQSINNQFDKDIARASRFLEQGEVVPLIEIKSVYDSFDFDPTDIVNFLINNDFIEPANEIKTKDDEEEQNDKEVKDIEPDFFIKGDNDVSSLIDTSDIKRDTDFKYSSY